MFENLKISSIDLFQGFLNFLSSAKNHYRFFYQAKKITTTKFKKKITIDENHSFMLLTIQNYLLLKIW